MTHTAKSDSRKKGKRPECAVGQVWENAYEKSLQKIAKNVEKLLFGRGQVRDETKKRLRFGAGVFTL
jgi:hypothetical protein